MQVGLERERFGLSPQIVDAFLSCWKHRQHAVGRAGCQNERVVGDALARLRRHGFRGAIDLLDARAHLERDPFAGNAGGPRDRRVLRHRFAGQHRLRQRRLLVGLAVLVAEHQNVGSLVLIAGRERGANCSRSAADDDNLAGVTHCVSCWHLRLPARPAAGVRD